MLLSIVVNLLSSINGTQVHCSIMAAAPSLLTARLSDLCRHIQHDVRETTHRAGLSVTVDTCQIFFILFEFLKVTVHHSQNV